MASAFVFVVALPVVVVVAVVAFVVIFVLGGGLTCYLQTWRYNRFSLLTAGFTAVDACGGVCLKETGLRIVVPSSMPTGLLSPLIPNARSCFDFLTTIVVPIAPMRKRTKQAGMMSYPNYNGEGKALQYVDLRLLAEEAERAGVDLRMVYLSRSARSILVSDTQHNHYGGT